MRKALFLTSFILLLSAAPSVAAEQEKKKCPPAAVISTTLEQSFGRKVQVKEVRPAPVEGLCEVFVEAQGRISLLYSDITGRYVVAGQIQVIDTVERRDLTRESLADYNRFTPEEMVKLTSLTALTIGKKGPEVYFVTDPM